VIALVLDLKDFLPITKEECACLGVTVVTISLHGLDVG